MAAVVRREGAVEGGRAAFPGTSWYLMRKKAYLPAFIVLMLMWLAGTAFGQLTITPRAIDLGVIQPETSSTHTLTVNNDSQEPVNLLSIEVCKACTKFHFVPGILQAGQSSTIEVTFAPTVKDEGPINRFITVHTSDPWIPKLSIPVRAFVTTTIGFWPPIMTFVEESEPAEELLTSVEIVNISTLPLVPLYATNPPNGPKLEVSRSPIPGKERAILRAHWKTPIKPDQRTGQMVLFVDHPIVSKLTVPYQLVSRQELENATVPQVAATQPLTPTVNPVHPQPDTTAASSPDTTRFGTKAERATLWSLAALLAGIALPFRRLGICQGSWKHRLTIGLLQILLVVTIAAALGFGFRAIWAASMLPKLAI